MAFSRPPKHTLNILERPIPKSKAEVPTVSLSAYALLLSEIIQYHHKRVSSIDDFSDKLTVAGFHVGQRVLELLAFREAQLKAKRQLRVLDMLQYCKTTLWPYLFDKQADSLEQSRESADEYMIIDHSLTVTKFVSVPSDLPFFHPGALVAGIVTGVLASAGFPATVTAHYTGDPNDPSSRGRTTILIKFDQVVIQREAYLKQRGG